MPLPTNPCYLTNARELAQNEQEICKDSHKNERGACKVGALGWNARGAAMSLQLKRIAAFAHDAAAETLWPTRCVVCDTPGTVLCNACRMDMPCIDAYAACPVCGEPYGRVQCSRCLAPEDLYAARSPQPLVCRSFALFEGGMAKAVRAYKDAGERRLAEPFADMLADIADPVWVRQADAVAFVPATAPARRVRGFDHMELVADGLARRLGLPLARLLRARQVSDQRELGRELRRRNMEGAFDVRPGESVPARIILVDDVLTTGATLEEATAVLARAGAEHVACLTLARA